MQPKLNMKKTLLASTLIIGLGNAFTASSDTFKAKASAISDVTVAPVSGFTSLSFGEGIKGEKIGQTCTLAAATVVQDSQLLVDRNQDGNDDGTGTWAVSGGACDASTTNVSAYMLEIDGADTATVSVTIQDVIKTGYTWSPGAETCVVKFTGTTANDSCDTFASSNTVTGVRMSLAHTGDAEYNNTANTSADEYPLIVGKTRMVIGGEIEITGSGITNGTDVTADVVVQVTYE